MNDMTVGMENLPNVFIDKIIIEINTDSSYLIQVALKMFDYEDDPSWRGRLLGLQVKCALVSDDKISGLNNGQLSLYDIGLENSDKVRAESCDQFYPTGEVGGYKIYTTTFNFTTPASVASDNLFVYAACFIDDFQFRIPLFDKFYGPMVAEKIFIGGVPNQESGYFYNPITNEEYGGPVHMHSSGYMAGSEHTGEPHPGLRYVPEENLKISAPEGIGAAPDIEEAIESSSQNVQTPTLGQIYAGTAQTNPGDLPEQVLAPTDFTTAEEYRAYLNRPTAQQPNFNLVGNPTPIDPPPGY